MPGFCFAAGTLIHTSNGLVPIEKIQVGDLVLAQPEGKGGLAYRRVARTMHLDQGPVVRVCYTPLAAITAAISEGRPRRDDDSRSLIVTANHSFYVTGYSVGSFPPDEADAYVAGWRSADCLESGALLELADGQQAVVEVIDQIWRTRTEGVGWIELSRDSDEIGHLIDLRNGEVLERWGQYVGSGFEHDGSFLDRHDDDEIGDYWAYKCPVYSLEVEEFQTYYVGDLGVWVRQ